MASCRACGRYVNHVVTLIGGVEADLKSAEQEGAVFVPVARARQERALAFLSEHVFEAPTWLLDRAILERVGGGPEQLQRRQAAVLAQALNPARLVRLAEHQVTSSATAWPLADYLDALRQAVWRDLTITAQDPYRRALHRAWVDRLGALLIDPETPPTGPAAAARTALVGSDVRPLVRAQMEAMRGEAERAAGRSNDRVARAHLRDIAFRIGKVLDD
jgi:hypothetical protein